jgi:ATP-dependent DNA helicase DinG
MKNFPQVLRERQSHILNEISAGFASGCKYIVLEAPTGFGKSPVAITVARTSGTSYICTSTKDLQTRYSRDFPFVKVAKGKNNFICNVREDFIRNGTYMCGLCGPNNANECRHTSAEYGPCISNPLFKHEHCRYRISSEDYKINKGSTEEEVFIDDDAKDFYQKRYSEWWYIENLREELRIWRPCEYYHQINTALASTHAILNYSLFLALSFATYKGIPSRDLLILDEVHRLEEEIVKFVEISISKRRWKRYIPDFKMVNYGFDDIESWIEFLIELERKMFLLTEGISEEVAAEDMSEEVAAEAKTETEKLGQAIRNLRSNPRNWIVSEIKENNNEVINVKLKPLDVSPFCKEVFEKCTKTLMMSATILDKGAFCTSLGLAPGEVKFIQVASDFPLQNRPIYPLNIAYLNSDSLRQEEVQIKIARATDNLMTLHRNEKGIIHTTSYKQLDFIKENISHENKHRFLETSPEIQQH